MSPRESVPPSPRVSDEMLERLANSEDGRVEGFTAINVYHLVLDLREVRRAARRYIEAWNNLDVPGDEGDAALMGLAVAAGVATEAK